MTNGNDLIAPAYTESNPEDTGYVHDQYGGLSKREYFAAMAMQGVLSNSSLILDIEDSEADHRWIAEHSVKCADVLIEALNAEAK